jgi:hypothetical protein
VEIRPETENNLDRLSIYNQEMVENMGCEELDVGPVYRPLQAEAEREALTAICWRRTVGQSDTPRGS